MVVWYGFVAPAATPKDILARLSQATSKAVALFDMRDLIAQHGVDPETNTPEQFTQYLRDEYARWGKVIRAAGVKVE